MEIFHKGTKMAYSEELADKVRGFLPDISVEEKRMFGGLCFMVNGKMCISVKDQRLMCRVDPAIRDELIAQGARAVIMGGREYKGYVHVDQELVESLADLDYWLNLALDFNDKLDT